VTTEVGLGHVYNPMGSNFGDFDNDGFLDFYLGSGTPPYGDILPNVLYHNQHGEKFVTSPLLGHRRTPQGTRRSLRDLSNTAMTI